MKSQDNLMLDDDGILFRVLHILKVFRYAFCKHMHKAGYNNDRPTYHFSFEPLPYNSGYRQCHQAEVDWLPTQ